MKKLCAFLILSVAFRLAFGQTEARVFKKEQLSNKELSLNEHRGQFLKYDFASLYTEADNQYVYGFIGDNYQRIRIKIIRITKDTLSSDTYNVYGKSMVKNNIDEFHGTIKITNIREFKVMCLGVDDELRNKGNKGQYVIIGDYSFSEDEKQSHSGVFKGTFRSNFYLDKKNTFHYDDIENYADGYCNNQFVGKWIEYKTNLAKRCNWGDYRIPNSSGFDIGAGEFSPSKGDGWQSVQERWSADKKIKAKAKLIENAKWWK